MRCLRVSILLNLLFLAGAFAAGAADVELTYSYDYNALTATVTGVSGGMSAARGDLVIPSTITRDDKTYTVKAIMNGAFSSCRGFTGTLTIPESVTIIGESAFAGCSGLTGNLVIPESVTAIGDGAFYGCKSFTGDLTVPPAITTIRYKTFNGCSGFTRLIIPETVTNIGPEAFYGCSGLTGELLIPESVTSIGSDAFYQCSGFTGHLTIPASVKTIGSGAFQKCWGFTGLTIPESVTKIESSVFSTCFGLKGNLIIPESVTGIGDDAFNNCWSLSGDLVIPSSVTEIGSRAFYECEGFIGNLVLPESLVTIGAQAFQYCPGLNGTLRIPESVTTIGDYAFNGCVSFTELIIPESVKTLGMYAFSGCEDLSGDLVLPNSLTSIGDGAFSNCTGFRGSLKLPESVVTIGNNAFKGCNRLTGNLVLPSTVRTIGEAAFSECTGFTGSLIIPESVETIGNRAFDRCTGFTGSLVIPNSVTSIGTGAFWHCTGFKGSLTISESASSIGENAFAGCSGFNSVMSLNPVPPQCDGDIGLSKLSLEVPRGSFKVYETTSPWSTCYPILPFNGVLINGIIYEIIRGDGENGEDTALVFGGNPDNDGALEIIGEVETEGKKYPVTRIDEGAFKDRQSIRNVTIPASVASVGDEAFSGCGKLVEVIAEGGDETLEFGADVFNNTPVTTLYLGRNTSGSPFAEVADLVTLTLGDKVTEIGSGDFGGCNSITNIFALNVIPPALPDDGFSQDVCDNAVLKVPDEGIFDYILAAGWKKFLNIIGEYAVIPDGIIMEPAEIELIEEESAQLGVTISPENATDKTVRWTTSDAQVATVDSDGLVTAVKPGKAIITAATRNMLTAMSRINVLPKPDASGVSLNIVAVEIVETETLQLTAVVAPENAADKTVTWSSSSPSVATVDANGLVTALKAGTVMITAETVTGIQAVCKVTVVAKVIMASGLSLNIENVELVETETLQLTATIKPEDTTDRTVRWNSSQEEVATVDANGLVTAVKEGTAVITAETVTGIRATCKVTVVAKVVAVSALSITPGKAEIIESNVLQLTATVLPLDATDKSVVWSTSDETIGTVSSAGLFTAVKPGTVIVTVTASNGLTATCEITVIAKPSGIEGIDGDRAQVRVESGNIIVPEGSEVFDLNGHRVKPTALRAGIYIVKLPAGKAVKVLVD